MHVLYALYAEVYVAESLFVVRKTAAQRAGDRTKAPDLQPSTLCLGARCFPLLWVSPRGQTAIGTSCENGPSPVPGKLVSVRA